MSDARIPPPSDNDDELLDALVRRACRGDVDPLALDRLASAWHREMDQGRRMRARIPLAAAACVAAIAGTLALFSLWPEDTVRQQVAQEDHGSQRRQDVADDGAAERPLENQPDDPAAPRQESPPEPTAYERLLVHAALQRQMAPAQRHALSVRRKLVEYLASLQQADARTAERIAADLGIDAAELEAELARLCRTLRGPRRERAIELLGQVATTAESLTTLLQLWNQVAYQELLVDAVARLADPPTLAACYLQGGSPRVRRTLATGIVGRLTPGDGRLLVELLTRSRRPEELIAAVRRVDGPLYTALFAELDAENRAVRFAAARALAALNAPAVTRRLIDYVASGHRRQEALVALAESREPGAVAFVSQARGNAVLATALQSALVQSSTSHQWYGG